MNTRLCTLFLMLLAALLPSCGTAFFRAPYNVGIQKPFVENSSTKGQELYRIGADYYVRCEVVYAPVQAENFSYYTWDFFDSHFWFGYSAEVPAQTAGQGEKATFYCRVPEDLRKNRPLADYCKPLPQTGGHSPDVLSEQEALQLTPVLVKRFEGEEVFLSRVVPAIPERTSWTHFAMLPVAGLTAVAVDLPCSIVSSIYLGVCYVIFTPFIH